MVMKDVFDRSRYGSGYDVSELVQKILSERQRDRGPSPTQTEDRVIYANPDRSSIMDNVTQPLRSRFPEIPEGGDEKDFVEKTLAPSGRRWTSSPPLDSRRVVVVRETFNDDYFDGGLQYEELGTGARVCGTSLENWRDSSCRSPSNVPDTLNGDGVESGGLEARLTGSMPATGRTMVTSESTRRHDVSTAGDTAPLTSMTRSRKDAFGRYIPADAVEIKVKMQRGESDNNEEQERLSSSKSRLRDQRNTAAMEQWLDSSGDKASYASRQQRFVGDGVVETDEKLEARSGGVLRHEKYSDHVKDAGMSSRTSSGDGWTRVTGTTKSIEKTVADDGRIWIPVIHVSGSPAPKNEATRSDTYRSEHMVEAENRGDEAVSPSADGRGHVVSSSRSFVVDQRSQGRSGSAEFRESARDAEATAEVDRPADQSAATSSLRTGSGVGSYGFRSSIVVDPASPGSTRGTRPAGSQTSTSRSAVVMQQSASSGEWIVEKAL